MAKKIVISNSSTLSDSKYDDIKSGDDLLYGKRNYIFFGIGTLLIIIGLVLMSGGHMPSKDVWDESLIYSFRRITLAPIVILTGLGFLIYSVFTRK
ncbi:MAG: DUF3098 domain-containing protein [Saprospiraceae bacterium]|nr:DUF3098 domain-containing protein [Saprospiraceae bacterium]MCB9329418.1 DUF3098 domain-containing protein [Lewinellaceae bacterium]HPK10993.1 DUF3098 domain-containing protein [Saprospiraceae bacterium]